MDPDATWVLMLEAYSMEEYLDAAEHAESLLNWLRAGGFPPLITVAATGVGVSLAIDDIKTNRLFAAETAKLMLATPQKKIR